MSSRTVVPPHVPPELVRSFNFWSAPGMRPEAGGDPHAALACLRDEPRIFYSARNTAEGYGTWVLTRAEDMRAVLQDADTFSSSRKLFSPLVGEDWPLVPLEIDPPEHTKFRALLNPMFSPKRMQQMQIGIRARAIELLEGLKERGECDFMTDFAFPFAVSVLPAVPGVATRAHARVSELGGADPARRRCAHARRRRQSHRGIPARPVRVAPPGAGRGLCHLPRQCQSGTLELSMRTS